MNQNYLNDELETQLKIINGEEIEYALTKTNLFYHKAKQNLKKLNGYYRRFMPYDTITQSDRLFCDSFYKLSQLLQHAIKQLKNATLFIGKSGEEPRFYRFLKRAIASKTFSFSTESMIALIAFYQKKHELLNLEYYLLADFMTLIISDYAIDYCEQGYDEKESFSHSIKVLYEIQSLDMETILQAQNKVEAILNCDYQDIYSHQTKETRNQYRYMVSKLAQAKQEQESDIANFLIDKSKTEKRHVGFLLYQEYGKTTKKEKTRKQYISMLYLLPLLLDAVVCFFLKNWWIGILLYFPMIEVLRPIITNMVQRKIAYLPAPKMELKDTVSQENKTLVVISTILPEESELSQFQHRIEKTMLSQSEGSISYVILADFKQALTIETPTDQILLNQVDKIIKELNKNYHNNLLLLVRPREYSKTQNACMGKERKRGAVEGLIATACGEAISYLHHCGNMELLNDAQYLMALDYDTDLTLSAVSGLLEIAVHPCNKPVIDEKTNQVQSGYGIIVPEIQTELKSSLKTAFSRIMGGIGGISSYDTQSGEFYQNVYDNSIFTGKGLIHIKTYHQVMKQRFASETVLSHDILEGAFLRVCHTTTVQLLDGFPSHAKAYFKRLHRWVRGDAQNVAFLKKQVEGEAGYYQNPITALSKYQIWDNIRRAITPLFSMVAILLSGFSTMPTVIGTLFVVLLSCMMPYFFRIVHALFSGRGFSLFCSNFSGIPSLFLRLLYCGILQFLLLPQYAYVEANAVVIGLFRRFVSHKNMLEWVTASQTQREHAKAIDTFLFYLPSLFVSAFLLLLPNGLSKLTAVSFALGILFMVCSQKETEKEEQEISQQQYHVLQGDLEQMLSYYQTYCTEETNFLPPDNVQRLPVSRVAYRTSPTNIGMMLVSYLSARDFNLITDDQLFSSIDQVLKTVEQLQTYRGNLYNWYDIKTLQALPPYFVSTVDSGNFLCSLVCLKEGLKEYQKENSIFSLLIAKIEGILATTELSCFYNETKKLFHIGYDTQAGALSNSYYDTLMSEARMTSYYAVAKGIVPKEHWSSLSRMYSKRKWHSGALSWTGTMFEYFMPELFLHCVKGSLGYEALHYCVLCQKSRVRQKEMPYGISESAIYAFDGMLNYQYNPNGVQRIALKQGQNLNLVVAPYASYLTLSVDFESAYDNLMRLKQLGVEGVYGLYEALDYTKARIGENDFIPVYSYMAHHLGMSIVAITNALHDNSMQKRFMRDKSMQRAQELLQENMDMGTTFLQGKNLVKKMSGEGREEKMKAVGKMHPMLPKANVLGNTELTGVYTDIGVSFLKTRRLDITRRSTELLKNPSGMFWFFHNGKESISLTYAPQYRSDCEYETAFSSGQVVYSASQKEWKSQLHISFHRAVGCQQQKITISNQGAQPLQGDLLFCLEPVLFPYQDDLAHQTFSKLFLSVNYLESERILIVQRRKRGNEAVAYLGVAFLEDVEFSWCSNREQVYERGHAEIVNVNCFTDESESNYGIPDAMVAIKKSIFLGLGERKEYHLVSVVAEEKEKIVAMIKTLRNQPPINAYTNAKSRFVEDSIEQQLAQIIIPQVLYHKKDSSLQKDMVISNRCGKADLWKVGISGDFPLALVEIMNEKDTQRMKAYFKVFSLLQLYGVYYDLVFLYEETTEENLVKRKLEEYQRELCGHALDYSGHVLLLEKSQMSEEIIILMKAFACHIANRSMVKIEKPLPDYLPKPILEVERALPEKTEQLMVEGGFFSGDSFYITEKPRLPWCHVLANPTFGTLVTDSSVGFSWAINARENKLTPWSNDTIRDLTGEHIFLRYQDEIIDCVKGAGAEYNPHYVRFYGEYHEMEITTTITVPVKGMLKYIEVAIHNVGYSKKKVELAYYTEPTMAVNRENCFMIKPFMEEETLLFQNSFQMSGNAYMGITAFTPDCSYTCNRFGFYNGAWESSELEPTADLCGAISLKKAILPQETVKVQFALCFSSTKKGLKALLQQKPQQHYAPQRSLQIKSPDETINQLMNTWLPHQMIASRIYGRTGFYQCGGAYGFRDQLQDCINYLFFSPKLLKTHILRCCAVQFEAGDVMHWWHSMPQSGGGKKGVRTRYSDDLIWLVYAVNEYVKATGDGRLLKMKVPYLVAPEIPENQKDLYLEAKYTAYNETVYDHCKRALKRAYRLGQHGLPLMGSGDWNDGYSKVGTQGEGESVWLAQFLSLTLRSFAKICEVEEPKQAEEYRQKAERLLENVDKFCYDKDHYIRAFFDNGEPMGSYQNEECKIDSLPQAFSVFSQMPDTERINLAMETAYHMLVDEQYGIIKLFTPPFHSSKQEPGYVKAYPKGVRENGGQYTHAAVWFAMAMNRIGERDKFIQMMDYLNPIKKSKNKQLQERYQVEPYYMAADIYTNHDCYGRGGWSIYTGTAGWYYRLLLQEWAGVSLVSNQLTIQPQFLGEKETIEIIIKSNDKEIAINATMGETKQAKLPIMEE